MKLIGVTMARLVVMYPKAKDTEHFKSRGRDHAMTSDKLPWMQQSVG